MINLPETELKLIANSPDIYIKYENHLPFGGGNKVRRFLTWLAENPSKSEINIASDMGSHSFLILAQILNSIEYDQLHAIFWERQMTDFPEYRDKNRSTYLQHPRIKIKKFTYHFYLKWLLNYNKQLFSIGGHINLKQNPYADVLTQSISQLPPTQGQIWHFFPLASGCMANYFLRYFAEHQLDTHKIIALLTGDKLLRPFIKLRYFFNKKIYLYETTPVTWETFISFSENIFKQYKIKLDPIHSYHVWRLLQKKPEFIGEEDVILVWLTQPNLT